ncbi:uncharacterized protein LOC122505577 [Leptopilina heterotoma]|uniref:uncharacterized protein LOC122505577 n=1 Tax=Leptopilina heterotoma TaxID=63436 RepID=UPI001CA8F565|nr:uncharacterized protein LOC122505577 [Leptopilina heterotoma]
MMNQSISEEEADEFAYQLVSFPGYEDSEGKKPIDIVLSSWMKYKKKKNIYVTKFAPPPYNVAVKREMNNLLKSYSPAPAIWPEYEVSFHGHAKTLQEAKKRLSLLATNEFVYSSGAEVNKKVNDTKKRIRAKRIQVTEDEEDSLLNVPDITENLEELHESMTDSNTPKKKSKTAQEAIKKSHTKPMKATLNKNTTDSSSTSASDKNYSAYDDEDYDYEDYDEEEEDIFKTKLNRTVNSNYDQRVPPKTKNTVTTGNRQITHSTKRKREFENETLNPSNRKETHSSSSKGDSKRPRILETVENNVNIFTPNISLTEEENPLLIQSRIIKALHILHVEIKDASRELRDIKAILIANGSNEELPKTFAEKYNIELPFGTLNEFQSMDMDLKTNKTFRHEFKQTLSSLIDKNKSLSRSFINILKMYFARDVMLLFNASKKTEAKQQVLKETEFYKCMLDYITKKWKSYGTELIEKDFLRVLGPVITNATDWDGHRSSRTKKIALDEFDDEFDDEFEGALEGALEEEF